ncbi:type I-E CRISPR-associated protein Cas6/Cse3/CasE [Nocardia sp. NPDC049190]|uniref:type I-E CRISPR-associated protein Cas6/Cse3/CasE n=1 Tax=Nocardia sp. NPDC049190 TaxID=3155650 RepID=UPI0033C18EE1
MTYLSRIWLNPLRTGAQRLIRNPHTTHAAVLGGISHQPLDERVLWRLDHDTPHRATLLVLTRSMPSWDHIIEQAGWTNADEPQARTKSYQPLLDRVIDGAVFRFKLRASPTYTTKKLTKPSHAQQEQLARDRPRGIRVPHRTAVHQLNWFLEKSRERWGFTTQPALERDAAVVITERKHLTFKKNHTTNTPPVTLHTATFEGILRITENELARTSLTQGVGTARGYGCGLITLAPLVVPEHTR